MVAEEAIIVVVVQTQDAVHLQMEGGVHLQMKDAGHQQMEDHHLPGALVVGRQTEEVAHQEQEATDLLQEATTAIVTAEEKRPHQEVEAAHQADADAKKVALLQTGEH